jgi:hypothetical protein
LIVWLAGCSSRPEIPIQEAATPVESGEAEGSPESILSSPPNLWSGHKAVSYSPGECASRGVEILEALSFIGIVRNGSYVYGNLMANRAAIKCVSNGDDGTFVYAAVAGPEVRQVERLRNEIVWRLE